MTQENLTQIEMTLAHHEDQLQSLSDIITRQWKEIELLKQQLHKTYAKLESLEGTSPNASEKPPHY